MKKITVFGGDGFIGKRVVDELSKSNEVVKLVRHNDDPLFQVDLMDKLSVTRSLEIHKPDVIVSCAGVVRRDEAAHMNIEFAKNIFAAIELSGHNPRRVILTGSASVYGKVDELPVSETAPTRAEGFYAEAKLAEEEYALASTKRLGIQTVVARVFNPLGSGMPGTMLLPQLLVRASDIMSGQENIFTVSRLDSVRDYVDVRDVARAFSALVSAETLHHDVYNVGSGKPTSNRQILDAIMDSLGMSRETPVEETMLEPEIQVASQADISRLVADCNWSPMYTIKRTIEDVIHENT